MLAPGERLDHYELVEKIGEGGMGVVWKATDTTLGRSVAIKVLPDELARDGERLARFEREAKLLASLNHPHIATIYGLGTAAGVTFLAMELIDGVELGARLSQGALPLEEALEVAAQLAEALEAAHASGVVHRDLKPANIKITADGTVKVLDFGLAKAFAPEATDGDASASLSPTVTSLGSVAGVILGTASYMSPEQARGHPVDRRADIFAFGCVLYEMLTGRRLFGGETISDTLASVLKVDPDWGRLPAETPAALRRLLRRCLEKSPKQRLHDIADARIILGEIRSGVTEDAPPAGPVRAPAPAWQRLAPWGVAAALGLALAAVLIGRGGAASVPGADTSYVSVNLTDAAPLRVMSRGFAWPALDLSADGRRLAYASPAGGEDAAVGDKVKIWLRDLGSPEPVPLAGTERGHSPFFSPDGEWVGFFAGPQIKKVSVSGRTTVDVCEFSGPFSTGGSWGPDGTIVFSAGLSSGLSRVSADGGTPELIASPARERGEVSYRHPQVLPNGRGVVFTVKTAEILEFDDARIAAVSLETGEVRTLIQGGMYPRYLSSGHLVYSRSGSLLAVPFDAERLEVTGAPIRLVDGVAFDQSNGVAHYDVSENGTLAYVAGGSLRGRSSLVWVDRQGNAAPAIDEIRHYQSARLSPDGRRIVLTLPGANNKLWLIDRERQVFRRLTFGSGNDSDAVWSPDGQWIAFSSDRDGKPMMYRVRSDGGDEEPLLANGLAQFPQDFLPDGSALIFMQEAGARLQTDLWTLPWDGGKPAPLMETRFIERDAALSPDGTWLAYASDESGEDQVYVQAFPSGDRKTQVTRNGGYGPLWSSDGRELFFQNDGEWRVVSFAAGLEPQLGALTLLFKSDRIGPSDVTLDGRQFLMIEETGPSPDASHVELVQNWIEDVRRRTR